MPTLSDLAKSSSLIFSGTVQERGRSTVPAVKPTERLVTVRVDRALRADPVLGDLRGKVLTVAAKAPENLTPGHKAIFFTNSWVHGRGIAVRELDQADIGQEEAVAAAVAQLPQLHLTDRLRAAQLVVEAEITGVSAVENRSGERKAAMWSVADLKVNTVLQGPAAQTVKLFFPTADWPPWTNAPRFRRRQRGIFILHEPNRDRSLSEASLEPGSLVALDPADFQPQSERGHVEALVAAIATEGGNR